MTSGLSPKNPLKYTGPNVYLSVVVNRNREPTGADYRQPETGRLYALNSFWLIGNNPTTGVEGDLWYLSKIVANVAFWLKFGTSISGLFSINVPFPGGPTNVIPTLGGLMTFTSTSGTVSISSTVANTINFDVTGGPVVEHLTGNSGGILNPIANNFNILGTGSIGIAGLAATLTVQLTGLNNHSVLVGAGTPTITSLAVGTNGQVLLGSTGADPVFGTLTSSDSSIAFTTGAGTLSLQVAGGTTTGKTITGNNAVALSPTAGNWNIFGASTAAGTTPVSTFGAGSTLTVNVQKAQAIALTNATNVGLAAFNSAEFTVDANGFVSLVGSGAALETVTGNDTLSVVPSSGNINLLAAVVTNGTDPTALYVKRTAASTETIDVQVAAANATSLVTKAGLASFNSTQFTVDANGFVGLFGGTTAGILTINSIVPNSSGNFNLLGTANQVAITAGVNQDTISLIGPYTPATYPIHSVLVGEGTSSIVGVGPNAASGIPLISQGVSADPIFGTAVVAGGGTGAVTFTPFAVITGGTTATGPLQNVVGLGTANQVLTSNGAGALPTWQNNTSLGNVSNFTVDTTVGGGVNPVVPNSGNIIITSGPLFATGTQANALRTDTTAAHVVAIELQEAGTSNGLIPIPSNYGVAQFNNANFTVSAGLVTPLAITINTAGIITGGGTVNLGGSITLSASGAIFPWSDKAASFNALSNNGYFVTGVATATLPAVPAEGDTIDFIVDTASLLTIQANTGQKIRLATKLSAAAGTAINTQQGDAIELVYRLTTTTWLAQNANGGWNIT